MNSPPSSLCAATAENSRVWTCWTSFTPEASLTALPQSLPNLEVPKVQNTVCLRFEYVVILQGHAHEQTLPRTTDGSRIPSGLNCSQRYMTCCGHIVTSKSECAVVMSAGTVQALAPLELEIIVRAVPLVPCCCCGLLVGEFIDVARRNPLHRSNSKMPWCRIMAAFIFNVYGWYIRARVIVLKYLQTTSQSFNLPSLAKRHNKMGSVILFRPFFVVMS
jgi:hypothetical protein